jgi:heme-degrading monooxygenase HmoA
MFTVLQRYRVRLGTIADAAARAEESLVPRLKDAPGFVAYQLLHTGDGTVAALAQFDTKPAADAAARLLTDWFRSDWPAFRLLAPDLSVAESLTLERANGRDQGAGVAAPASGDEGHVVPYRDQVTAPEQAIGAEPQVARDRRRIGERRLLVVARVPERRSGVERRVTDDRRLGSERRGTVAVPEAAAPLERRRIAPAWRRRDVFHAR